MRRLAILCAALGALALAPGCKAATITAPGAGDGDGGVSGDPRAYFEANVQPHMMAVCRNCHEVGSASSTAFIDPADYYNSTRVSGFVVPGEPDMSALLTEPRRSTHRTDWPDGAEASVETWIRLEGESGTPIDGGPGGKPTTEPGPVLFDTDRTPHYLDSVGLEGGARLEFYAARASGESIRLQSLEWFGGTTGIAADGPRFVVVDPSGERIVQSSSFVAGPVRVDPAMSQAATASPVVLPTFPDGSRLAIQFDSVQAAR